MSNMYDQVILKGEKRINLPNIWLLSKTFLKLTLSFSLIVGVSWLSKFFVKRKRMIKLKLDFNYFIL